MRIATRIATQDTMQIYASQRSLNDLATNHLVAKDSWTLAADYLLASPSYPVHHTHHPPYPYH